jgi:hypothetical protein
MRLEGWPQNAVQAAIVRDAETDRSDVELAVEAKRAPTRGAPTPYRSRGRPLWSPSFGASASSPFHALISPAMTVEQGAPKGRPCVLSIL